MSNEIRLQKAYRIYQHNPTAFIFMAATMTVVHQIKTNKKTVIESENKIHQGDMTDRDTCDLFVQRAYVTTLQIQRTKVKSFGTKTF